MESMDKITWYIWGQIRFWQWVFVVWTLKFIFWFKSEWLFFFSVRSEFHQISGFPSLPFFFLSFHFVSFYLFISENAGMIFFTNKNLWKYVLTKENDFTFECLFRKLCRKQNSKTVHWKESHRIGNKSNTAKRVRRESHKSEIQLRKLFVPLIDLILVLHNLFQLYWQKGC